MGNPVIVRKKLPTVLLVLNSETHPLKIRTISCQFCLQFGDFDVFLDVILEERSVLRFPFFPTHLFIATGLPGSSFHGRDHPYHPCRVG